MTHKDPSILGERPERLVQRLVHLLAVALEEPAAAYRSQNWWTRRGESQPTSVEQGIPRKHDLVVAVLHEEADAVLSVARRVQRLDGDAADVECLVVFRCLGHLLAVLAANDVKALAELGEL